MNISEPTSEKYLLLSLQMGWASFNVKDISHLSSSSRRADALVDGTDGVVYFVEPHVEKMTMKELLGRLGQGLNANDI
jgi:hypothetical protein